MSETHNDAKSQEEDSQERLLENLELDDVEEIVEPVREDETTQEGIEEEPDGHNIPEDVNGRDALVGSDCLLGPDEQELHWGSEEDLESQQWSDGSSYKGHMAMNLKRGFGEFKWANGESYVGEFYKDHHHGRGIYTWPDGSRFTGSFYLSRKEGYGTMRFPDGRTYQGLYKADVRFGPGVESYSDGCQDVGIWMGQHLFRLCTLVPGSVSMSSFPQFSLHFNGDLGNSKCHSSELPKRPSEDPFDFRYKILLREDSFTLTDKIYSYSLDTDHLPITCSQHREFDSHFYRDYNKQEESEDCTSDSTHRARSVRDICLHVNLHRNRPEHLDWNMCSIMDDERDKFGPKGPRERSAEQLIEMSGLGDTETISAILRHDLAHVDVSDNSGQTALHAATVNGHNNVINLLLDNGADVNQSNDEGLSALSLCLVLFYSTKSFWPNVAERNLPVNKEEKTHLPLNSCENESCAMDEKGTEKNGETGPGSGGSLQTSDGYRSGDEAEFTVDRHRNKNFSSTMNLLLLRGADPSLSSIPMNALFFAIKAADVGTVEVLLQCGARTDVRLKTQHGSLTPLHIAAALPVAEGIRITEILLHVPSDPNASAEDEDYVYDHDRAEINGVILGFSMKGGLESGLPLYNYFDKIPYVPEEGGRTPLHVACEREDNYKFARDTISLLLAHNANRNTLWSGHSPLSLAIASGNDLAVKELLANGADPNLALSRGVGSALCTAVNIAYEKKRTLAARIALVDRLIKAGANILMPIVIGGGKRTALGTATDYAYFKYFQDKRIAHTPYHALLPEERDTYNARKQLLEHLGKLTREAALAKEHEWAKEGIVREANTKANVKVTAGEGGMTSSRTSFKYCYQCGRSIGVKLTPCLRCYSIYTCSKQCKKRSWDELHKEECQQLTGKLSGKMSPTGRASKKMHSAKGRQFSPTKHLHAEKESSGHEAYGDRIPSTSENYSYN
ncbi:ankyrin repeat and MYND domain-containing protein 1 [Bufo gargarizans]|uniref:ankyrin repeat and MYND domain-containing protein 1 n=1 Tax=Bufo gargarizans TaxID=30331 RepID=UPI001CF5D666|nr:ankyrin repeat and MYND domain-containing protein 1 [Bufo gargarizans]